jgi:hypothetical protein
MCGFCILGQPLTLKIQKTLLLEAYVKKFNRFETIQNKKYETVTKVKECGFRGKVGHWQPFWIH